MHKIEKFVPITKIDKDQRMVYGFASTPDLDSDGEIIELSAIEKALPEYMKFPTIREMHAPKPIGKTVEAEIRRGEQSGLWIAAKIVSDDAWKMVKEGVLRAFSIGGGIVEKVDNKIKEMELIEISLVDVPANKHAVVEIWKREKQLNKFVDAFLKIEMYQKDLKGGDIAMSKISNEEVVVEKEELVEDKNVQEVENETPEINEDQPQDVVDEKATEEVVAAVEETEVQEEVADSNKGEEVTFEKMLDTADESLEKLTEVEEEKENVETVDFEKSFIKVAALISKMATEMAKMSERINELEKSPRPIKSQAAYVFKGKSEDTDKLNEKPEVLKAKERLAELEGLKSQMEVNDFARNYGKEVTNLYSVLDSSN